MSIDSPEGGAKRGNVFVRGFQKLVGSYEETPGEMLSRNQKDAQTLAKELGKQKGDRAVILSLGWRAHSPFGDNVTDRGYSVPFHYENWQTQSGDDLTGLYEQFKKIAPDERVALAVSDFKSRKGATITTVSDVVRKVVEVSEANGWTPPKVVGVPSEKQNYANLRAAFPDIYLGDYNYEGFERESHELHKKFFEAIEKDLPPSSVKLDRVVLPDITPEDREARERERKEENIRKLDAYEVSLEPKMRQGAQNAFKELETKEGERALIIIIDDTPSKIERAITALEEHAAQSGVSYVIKGVEHGSEGIVLYQQFAQIAPNERVIILMDGFLDGILDTGMKVTRRLADKVQQGNLSMPFLIGQSSDTKMNEELQKAYPDVYLGSFRWEEQEETLKNVRSKL